MQEESVLTAFSEDLLLCCDLLRQLLFTKSSETVGQERKINWQTFRGHEILNEETCLRERVPSWPFDACCAPAPCHRTSPHSEGCTCSADFCSVLCQKNRGMAVISINKGNDSFSKRHVSHIHIQRTRKNKPTAHVLVSVKLISRWWGGGGLAIYNLSVSINNSEGGCKVQVVGNVLLKRCHNQPEEADRN